MQIFQPEYLGCTPYHNYFQTVVSPLITCMIIIIFPLSSHLHAYNLTKYYSFFRCEDYILIDRGPYGTDEFCGNNIPEINPKNLARGGVKIKFRSSERIRERGFRMYILCFTDSKRSKRNINIGEFNAHYYLKATIIFGY